MKIGRFLLGVVAGVAAGYALKKVSEPNYIKPERALQMIKRKYKEKYHHELSIIGSWIHVEPLSEEMNGITYNIYQGGITGVMNDQPIYFEFKVDADTGSILKVDRQTRSDKSEE